MQRRARRAQNASLGSSKSESAVGVNMNGVFNALTMALTKKSFFIVISTYNHRIITLRLPLLFHRIKLPYFLFIPTNSSFRCCILDRQSVRFPSVRSTLHHACILPQATYQCMKFMLRLALRRATTMFINPIFFYSFLYLVRNFANETFFKLFMSRFSVRLNYIDNGTVAMIS